MKVIMPQIGMTMQEGTITEWFKKDGEPVEKGELLFKVETEKMDSDIGAPATGTLKIIAAVDDTIPCGEEVAEIIE